MQAISIDRSSQGQAAFVSLVTFCALLLLAIVMAYWSWRWLAPTPEPAAPSVSSPGGGSAGARGLFGAAPAAGMPLATTAVGIRLLGVVAGTDGKAGYAVLQLDGQPIVALRAGREIAPGILLAEVQVRSVVLERAGIRESLALPAPAAPTPPPSQ